MLAYGKISAKQSLPKLLFIVVIVRRWNPVNCAVMCGAATGSGDALRMVVYATSRYPNEHAKHALPYSQYGAIGMQSGGKYKKKRNLFTKLQLNMLQRRFAEKEHIRQPERDNFAQMIGLTGEQVKIWFQNQRYKRKHRESGRRNETVSGSSGANTSVSSLSSPSPGDSSATFSGNVKRS
ncbi:homeobox domain protein [Ostertagia ostertagi]